MTPDTRFAFRRSVSQRRTHRDCGLKYLHQYGQGWTETSLRGTFAFGIEFQETVNEVLLGRNGVTVATAPERFAQRWAARLQAAPPIRFAPNARVKAADLTARGPVLVRQALEAFAPRIRLGSHGYLDKSLTYELTPGLGGTGRPDIFCEGFNMHELLPPALRDAWAPQLSGWHYGIADFKTSGQKYGELDAELDEQLTEYQIAHRLACPDLPPVEWVALIVCIYTTVPTVQWLVMPPRSATEEASHIHTAQVIDAQIRAEVFPRNPRACFAMGECAFVPLCYPSQRHRIATDLVQRRERGNALDELDFME